MKKFTRVFLIVLALALVVCTMLTMTACKEKTSLLNANFEDGIFSWDKDSIVNTAADKYEVFVNKAKKAVQLSADGKKFFVDLSEEVKGGDFKVDVEAKGDDVQIDQTIEFRRLSPITVTIKNGVFDWSESAAQYASLGTPSYDVILDGVRLDPIAATSYKITTGVSHTISVRPRVYSPSVFYYSDWSEEVVAAVLSTPQVTNVSWTVNRDADENILTAKANIKWSSPPITSGVQYVVTVNGIKIETSETTLDTSTVTNLDVKEGFTITLQAKSLDGAAHDSAVSAEKSYVSLAKVKNVKVVDGVVYYDAVDKAASYCVNVDGHEHYSENTFYKLEDATNAYSIKVCALPKEGYEHTWNYSDVLNVVLLSAPSIRYNSKAFFITGNVENVASYKIKVEKEEEKDGKTVLTQVAEFEQDKNNTIFNTYTYGFKDAGVYYISVKAVADPKTNYENSPYSRPYRVVRLDTIPGLSIQNVPASNDADTYLLITIDPVKENAGLVTRYQLYMDGTEVSSTRGLEFKVPKPETYDEGSYVFSVQTISDDNGTGEGVTFSSVDAVSFRVYKLATPRNITLKESGSVSWSMPAPENAALKNASGGYNDSFAGYKVRMMQEYPVDPSRNEFSFPANLEPGTVNVSVYAQSAMDNNEDKSVKLTFKRDENGEVAVAQINDENATIGQGDIVISSDYSTVEILIKLDMPTDMSIENNILSWTGVEGAVGYSIYYAAATEEGTTYYGVTDQPIKTTAFRFDDVNFTAAENPELFVKSLLQEGGCIIHIVAVGNKGVALRNGERYSFDSAKSRGVTIFRNSAPTGLAVTDANLSWNSVANASYYEVYDYDALWTRVPNTSLNIGDLPSGVHKLSVVAGGNGAKFFDSARSEALTVYRLEEMQISKKENVYVWPALPFALRYQLVIDGKPATIDKDVEGEKAAKEKGEVYYYTYKPTFSEPKANTEIRYRAFANNGAENADFGGAVIASAEYSFEQEVKRLSQPQLEANATSAFTLQSNFGRIAITANVKDAPTKKATYKFEVATISYYSADKTFKYNENKIDPGTYEVRIAYGANYFDESGVYYLDSEFADLEPVTSVTFLRETYDIKPLGTGTVYTIEWAEIGKATGYRVFYEIYAMEGEKVGEGLYASSVTSITTSHYFSLDLSKDLGEDYVKTRRYAVRVYIVTFGNNTSSVSFYDIAEGELKNLA